MASGEGRKGGLVGGMGANGGFGGGGEEGSDFVIVCGFEVSKAEEGKEGLGFALWP